jgi:hypothetical protein
MIARRFRGFFFDGDPNAQPWAQALSYGVLGLVLMALARFARVPGASGEAAARP